MKSGQLVQFLATTLDRKAGTVADYVSALQQNGLFNKGSRGRYSGAEMTESDVVNGMLALTLDHRHGECAASNVRRVRNMMHDAPPILWPAGFTKGLTCFAGVTAGIMLENVVSDLRTGRFDAWAASAQYDFAVTMFTDGISVSMSLQQKQSDGDTHRAMQGFAKPGFLDRARYVERHITIGDRWFRQAAELLGSAPS
jgi:hypothetical protein